MALLPPGCAAGLVAEVHTGAVERAGKQACGVHLVVVWPHDEISVVQRDWLGRRCRRGTRSRRVGDASAAARHLQAGIMGGAGDHGGSWGTRWACVRLAKPTRVGGVWVGRVG